MVMAYRGDLEALEARVAALSADLAERERERDEAARMLEEARARASAEAFIADLESGGPARRRRKRLQIAAMIAGLVMIVGGLVAYRVRSHHDDRFEQAMQRFEQFTGEMCQCKDSACVTHVSDDMTRWSTAMQKDWQPTPKLDDAQIKRATAVGERMVSCWSKAMYADQSSDAQP
jgi:hypothetical protein